MKYKDGFIEICFSTVLDAMDDQSKIDLIESLSCEDVIIKHVADQIFQQCTDRGWHGGICCNAQLAPEFGLDYAKRTAAKLSSKQAKEEIERLEERLSEIKSKIDKHNKDHHHTQSLCLYV